LTPLSRVWQVEIRDGKLRESELRKVARTMVVRQANEGVPDVETETVLEQRPGGLGKDLFDGERPHGSVHLVLWLFFKLFEVR
jgi:hypothetical protein